ncbi:TraB/GumN family protein [Parasphingopyxis algicola]|uniref:TraB/GumN family protein n=1 Tax=Parasphingopyxis algicola TaxID=2026624 RepID=UPI00159FF29D|nr:TraB/GumN family protein [Parasphingopyxis algicola]QLC24515.1 TraB/GumN family protein [Parasphingopyxis algicola]
MRFTILTPILAAVAIALPAAAPAAERADEPVRTLEDGAPQPAIWLLADEDTRIWLFGTNHVLPHDFAWRSPDLDAIIREADELVLETRDEDADGVFTELGSLVDDMTLDKPVSILERVSPEYRMPLYTLIKYSGFGGDELDALETWVVALYLIASSLQNIYGDPEGAEEPTGVEYQLTDIFTAQGKPIDAVETPMEQIDFFRNLTPDGQRELLESLVAIEPEDGADEEEALRSWAAGDVARMDAECDDEESFPPELREILLRRRNADWTEWLVERLDRPGDVLFAVGACHLAGSVSLQTMLDARGHTVERTH